MMLRSFGSLFLVPSRTTNFHARIAGRVNKYDRISFAISFAVWAYQVRISPSSILIFFCQLILDSCPLSPIYSISPLRTLWHWGGDLRIEPKLTESNACRRDKGVSMLTGARNAKRSNNPMICVEFLETFWFINYRFLAVRPPQHPKPRGDWASWLWCCPIKECAEQLLSSTGRGVRRCMWCL